MKPMPYKLYLTPDQHAWARRKGLEHGITASAIVRLAITRLQEDIHDGNVDLAKDLNGGVGS